MLYNIHKLSFAYTAPVVLNTINFEIAGGDFVSVIGPNGAGKSTLLKLLTGLIEPSSGSILFENRELRSYRPDELARKIAFVPQETHVAFPFTAAEMMLMGRQSSRTGIFFDTEADSIAVNRAMQLTKTKHLAKRTFNELSGGERQRVVLGSALVQEPSVLILDEPTVYLDLKHQVEFYEMLAGLNRQGLTVVTVTHDINLAGRYAHRILVLSSGRISADGPPDIVLTPRLFEDVFGIRTHVVRGPEGGTYVIPSL